MNKDDVIKQLNELNKKGCKTVWFVMKNRHHQGANFNEIINDVHNECLYLKQTEIYMTINYSDLENIKAIY